MRDQRRAAEPVMLSAAHLGGSEASLDRFAPVAGTNTSWSREMLRDPKWGRSAWRGFLGPSSRACARNSAFRSSGRQLRGSPALT